MALHDVSSPPTATSCSAIKYTVEQHRKDGISKDEFKNWFTLQFLPRAIDILKKHDILRFGALDPSVGSVFLSRLSHLEPEGFVDECDFVLEYWMLDLGSMKSLSFDPEWVHLTQVEGNVWIDALRSTARISYDTAHLGNGIVTGAVQPAKRGRGRSTASFD